MSPLPLLLALLASPAAAQEAAAPSPPAAATGAGVLAVVTLSDGQRLSGQALRLDDGDVRLRLSDGQELLLPMAAVQRIVPVSEPVGTETPRWGLDPNRSRYLYSPTAYALGRGNGYVAQRALVLTSAAVGVTDWLDIEAGSVLPLLFTKSPVALVGLKVSVPVEERVHLGAGAQALVVPVDGVQAMGFAFGTVTVGTPDTHISVAGGAALSFSDAQVGAVVGTLSANHRLGPNTALLTETWVLGFTQGDGPWGGPIFIVPSGGVRLFGPSFAVDLALVPVVTGQRDLPVLPLPWVSFAWNWSLRRS